MAQLLELIADLEVVVDLAVVHQRIVPVPIDHRLIAAVVQVDDRQSPVSEADCGRSAALKAGIGTRACHKRGAVPVHEISQRVGPAMLECPRHSLEGYSLKAGRGYDPRVSAHRSPPSSDAVAAPATAAGAWHSGTSLRIRRA